MVIVRSTTVLLSSISRWEKQVCFQDNLSSFCCSHQQEQSPRHCARYNYLKSTIKSISAYNFYFRIKRSDIAFLFFFLLFKHFVWTGFTRIGTGQLVFMISVSSAWWIVDWTIKKCTHPTFSNCNSIPMPWLQISEIRSNTGIKWISCVFDCEEATAMLHPC